MQPKYLHRLGWLSAAEVEGVADRSVDAFVERDEHLQAGAVDVGFQGDSQLTGTLCDQATGVAPGRRPFGVQEFDLGGGVGWRGVGNGLPSHSDAADSLRQPLRAVDCQAGHCLGRQLDLLGDPVAQGSGKGGG
ncbi:hypothetical protein [Streptomyces hokutonensis]|uniref:hypothetical protein n=1 Tax=Streptomyces hokutonensis TaxID=1306990 RepID=UPI003821E6EA